MTSLIAMLCIYPKGKQNVINWALNTGFVIFSSMRMLAAIIVVAFILANTDALRSPGRYIYLPLHGGYMGYDAVDSSDDDPCQLPVDPGPGRAYFPSYYYDTRQSACLPFVYGGLKGNANRFRSIYECEAMCIINKA
ncbi:BPTI/Kunitz domain-containing protein [Echinococcus granulosus]|uniref:Papilin n=1 Tax=Echinococcus granulosus TaxID=6210 RepID=A0A068WQ34_ECHGR|nr:BPTI/Kunitz domain-containing protein [Echinococcus granulosus]CDS21887.1 Papilin [Echinococcus granulosus]